jgi:hypothetical protein
MMLHEECTSTKNLMGKRGQVPFCNTFRRERGESKPDEHIRKKRLYRISSFVVSKSWMKGGEKKMRGILRYFFLTSPKCSLDIFLIE